MKARARRLAIRATLEAIAATHPPRRIRARRVHSAIFTLHHVCPDPTGPRDFAPNAGLFITPDFLEAAIVECRACGFAPIALEDLPEAMAAEPGRRFVAFTLDDGCRDNRDHAAPVFRRHGVPYTLFVTQGFAARTAILWWEVLERLLQRVDRIEIDGVRHAAATPGQKLSAFEAIGRAVTHGGCEDRLVREIADRARQVGIDPLEVTAAETMDEDELRRLVAEDPLCRLGVHTVSHVSLAGVDEARLRQEIGRCAAWIETLSGRRPTTIAYPYGLPGTVGQREADAAQAAGLSIGVTTRPGRITGKPIAPLLMPRLSLNGHFQRPRHVRALLSGAFLRDG